MLARDHYIEHAGTRLRYRTAGDGPAVVLVHGWALDLDAWEFQLASLAERFRVIAFDRRGFGLSAGVPDIDHDVHDLRFLLDAFEVRRAAIVGMSQGARVALRFAVSFPLRTRCLVLDGPPREGAAPGDAAAEEVPMTRYRELLRRFGIDAVRQEWTRHPLLRLHTAEAGAHALLRRIVGRYPGHDLRVADSGPRSASASVAHALRSLRVPALVINGEHDSAERRAAGAELADLLPEAQSAVVPAAGHLPNLDNPAAYGDLLSGFLSLHARERPPEREGQALSDSWRTEE